MTLLQSSLALCLLSTLLITGPAQALDIGEELPSFKVSSYAGEEVSSEDLKKNIVVFEWFNSGCPFVVKHYKNEHMQTLQKQWKEKGVTWLTINSTAKDHQDYLTAEAAEKIKTEWKLASSEFLNDEDGTVGKQFGAKTTPHLFIFESGTLRYQGAIDDDSSADGDPSAAKNFVQVALEELSAGKPVSATEEKPYGCSVKYAE